MHVDKSGERLGKMIRNAEKGKIPVMAVIGAKEVDGNTLSIRTRQQSGDLGAMELVGGVGAIGGGFARSQ